MNRELIEVEHAGVEGTARMPASALKTMAGWKPVRKAAATTAPVRKTAAKKAAAKKTADSASTTPKEES